MSLQHTQFHTLSINLREMLTLSPLIKRRLSTHVQPAKRQRSQFPLLKLSEDLLVTIVMHVMSPVIEGSRCIVTEQSLRNSLPLASTCTTLYHLRRQTMNDVELWVSGKIDDAGLRSICRMNSSVRRLALRRCHFITSNGFNLISTYCTSLRSIDLSYTNIDHCTLLHLVKSTGNTLQFLALHSCTNLTTQSITAIADHCPRLAFLDIGSNPYVDDNTIDYLVRAIGPTIRTMVLSSCQKLSDMSMSHISLHCHSLISLTMRNLSTITDVGLYKLCMPIGNHLQLLDLLDCTGITMGGYYNTIQQHCPHIFRFLQDSDYSNHLGERCLRDTIIATMPGLIYRISATDAIRRLPALYFLLLDESTLRPFRVSVQSKSLNLSDFGTVLISNFGRKPTQRTKNVLQARFGYDSPLDLQSDDESCHTA